MDRQQLLNNLLALVETAQAFGVPIILSTRKETYDKARGLVERFGGGYGMGLKYARDMLVKP